MAKRSRATPEEPPKPGTGVAKIVAAAETHPWAKLVALVWVVCGSTAGLTAFGWNAYNAYHDQRRQGLLSPPKVSLRIQGLNCTLRNDGIHPLKQVTMVWST